MTRDDYHLYWKWAVVMCECKKREEICNSGQFGNVSDQAIIGEGRTKSACEYEEEREKERKNKRVIVLSL